jgi:hypothetical protein
MGLVKPSEVARAINIDKLGFIGNGIAWLLMAVTRINTCNSIYDKYKHLEGLDFINALLEESQKMVPLSPFLITH